MCVVVTTRNVGHVCCRDHSQFRKEAPCYPSHLHHHHHKDTVDIVTVTMTPLGRHVRRAWLLVLQRRAHGEPVAISAGLKVHHALAHTTVCTHPCTLTASLPTASSRQANGVPGAATHSRSAFVQRWSSSVCVCVCTCVCVCVRVCSPPRVATRMLGERHCSSAWPT